MTVCPVCEHQQQQGTACDNCGKVLVAVAPVDAPVQALPELERTQIANPKLAAPVEVVPELELTRLKVGPDLPAQTMVELDRHQIAPAGVVAVEAVPELDRGRELDDGQRTQVSSEIVCRYCRNVQQTGTLCDKCGMKLPKPIVAAAGPGKGKADGITLVVCGCGAKRVSGRRCGSCGARPSDEA